MAISLETLKKTNAERWANAKLTRASEFTPVAKRLVAAKERYQAVASQTGVPWYFIAVTHEREGAQDWRTSLAQGDPWNKKSTHVPKGRGPFTSWEEAAVDALVNCAPYAARNKDWSIGGLLTMLEQYNGLGYANRKIPSPYIWSGTDQYARGKYVADGKFNANTVDKQLGCAGLLLAMQKIDPSVTLEGPPHNQEGAAIEVVQRRLDAEAATKPARRPPAEVMAKTGFDLDLWYVQFDLKEMNYNPGGLDGLWGGASASAVAAFINDRPMKDGAPTSYEMFRAIFGDLRKEIDLAMAAGFRRPVAAARAEMTPDDLATKKPDVAASKTAERVGFWASVSAFFTTIVSAIISSLGDAVKWLQPLKELAGDVPWYVWIIGALVGSGLLYFASRKSGEAKNIATEAFRTGENL